MNLKQRINGFVQIGSFLERHINKQYHHSETQLHLGLEKLVETAAIYNHWFTPEYVNLSLKNLSTMLRKNEVELFCTPILEKPAKTIAIVCAGNIPLVCFHDVLCVLLCGQRVLIKMSSDDNVLLPFILKLLVHYEAGFEEKILFATGKLSDFDAIIATGSNNTSNYLHYYFSKYPNIIRKSRTSIAVLDGTETSEDLKNLGHDIFDYYGLGCRNVSKVLVPNNYSFNHFFESIVDFGSVVNNKKYGNNYDYYRSIYLLESEKFLDNNFLILKESNQLFSPVSVLFYESFSTNNDIHEYIKNNQNSIQCVIGKDFIPFGYSQQPVISEFADKINTVDFLLNL